MLEESSSPTIENALINEEKFLLKNNKPKNEEHLKSNLWRTWVNIFRGNIGAGVLGMPFAYKQSGLWVRI